MNWAKMANDFKTRIWEYKSRRWTLWLGVEGRRGVGIEEVAWKQIATDFISSNLSTRFISGDRALIMLRLSTIFKTTTRYSLVIECGRCEVLMVALGACVLCWPCKSAAALCCPNTALAATGVLWLLRKLSVLSGLAVVAAVMSLAAALSEWMLSILCSRDHWPSTGVGGADDRGVTSRDWLPRSL